MRPTAAVSRRYDQSPKGKFRSYRCVAKRRGIEFKLSFEEFVSFWQKECFYCHYKIHTVGLDRVANDKGYELGNVVSCCSFCNAAKSNLTQARFFELCRQVVLTHGLLLER